MTALLGHGTTGGRGGAASAMAGATTTRFLTRCSSPEVPGERGTEIAPLSRLREQNWSLLGNLGSKLLPRSEFGNGFGPKNGTREPCCPDMPLGADRVSIFYFNEIGSEAAPRRDPGGRFLGPNVPVVCRLAAGRAARMPLLYKDDGEIRGVRRRHAHGDCVPHVAFVLDVDMRLLIGFFVPRSGAGG